MESLIPIDRLQTGCGSLTHFDRRTLLKASGMAGLGWLTPVAELLAANQTSEKKRPSSVILLWLAGAPSQLETFDPHPDKKIAAGTTAIPTSIKGISLAEGMEQTADQMDSICILRNVVSLEGDHERALYNIKTGFRPIPALVHPAIGAVVCHQLPAGDTEIPRHVSILPDGAAARGGYLGDALDAFKVGDPLDPLTDLERTVDKPRFQRRLDNLSVVENQFAKGRLADLEKTRTSHRGTIDRAVRMMSSEQLKAFDLRSLPKAERDCCGDSPFGRGCLAAARLIEVGVRCVEITLGGWDSHVNNHNIQSARKKELDPAFAGLVKYLKDRSLLEDTIVICGGEFGRTPEVNSAGGRDHWPYGFSIAISGGGFPGGVVVGETDPEGSRIKLEQGIPVADIHATVLHSLGIDFSRELNTPIGRPMKLSEGKVIQKLVG